MSSELWFVYRNFNQSMSELSSIRKKLKMFAFPNIAADFSMRGLLGKSKTIGIVMYWPHHPYKGKWLKIRQESISFELD